MKSIIEQTAYLNTVGSTAGKIVLGAHGLRKSFGGQIVLNDLSADLQEGEIVLLRGDNGAGKTTLLNILTGNLQPDSGIIQTCVDGTQENFHFPASWWHNLNPFNHFTPERIAQEGIGRTWQEIRLFTTVNLQDNITVAAPFQIGENPFRALVRYFSVAKQEKVIRQESQLMLAKLGLSERAAASADKISLGQAKRIAIARAVQAGARVLFLDEPLAGLDIPGTNEVLDLLNELSITKKITLVIVEHVFNIPRILNFATTVWTLKDGKLAKEEPNKVNKEVLNSNSYDFKHWLNNMAGTQGQIVQQHLPGGAILSTVNPDNLALADGQLFPPVLEISDLVVSRGKRPVIEGLSLTIRKGQLALLQAPNGWGKTTLFEAIAGLLPISSGKIIFQGKPIDALPAWKRASLGLSLLQSRDNFFPSLTVGESFQLAHVLQVPNNIKHMLNRRMSDLSGGEKQRVITACMLSSKSFQLGLLDEPFSALDPERIMELTSSLSAALKHAGLLIAAPAAIPVAQTVSF